jgi:hypothetical protein
MHREHVDDVGPVVAMSVAVAEQLRGDRVTVGLVMDQNAAEVVSGLRVERFQQGAKVRVVAQTGAMPIITSVALTIAKTDLPVARPRRSADSLVMAATICAPFTSTVTSAITPPSDTDTTVPASWFLANDNVRGKSRELVSLGLEVQSVEAAGWKLDQFVTSWTALSGDHKTTMLFRRAV